MVQGVFEPKAMLSFVERAQAPMMDIISSDRQANRWFAGRIDPVLIACLSDRRSAASTYGDTDSTANMSVADMLNETDMQIMNHRKEDFLFSLFNKTSEFLHADYYILQITEPATCKKFLNSSTPSIVWKPCVTLQFCLIAHYKMIYFV